MNTGKTSPRKPMQKKVQVCKLMKYTLDLIFYPGLLKVSHLILMKP